MSDALDRLTAALADRYSLERELGQGGMATVYLAEDLKHSSVPICARPRSWSCWSAGRTCCRDEHSP